MENSSEMKDFNNGKFPELTFYILICGFVSVILFPFYNSEDPYNLQLKYPGPDLLYRQGNFENSASLKYGFCHSLVDDRQFS